MQAAETLLRVAREPVRLALVAAAFWIGVGFLAGTVEFVASWLDDRPVAFHDTLFAPLLAGLLWVPITVAGFALVRRAPVRGTHWRRGLVVHVVAAAAAPFALNLGYAIAAALSGRLGSGEIAGQTLVAGLRWFHVNAGAYLVIAAVAHTVIGGRTAGQAAPRASAGPLPRPSAGQPPAAALERPAQRIRVTVGRTTRYVDVGAVDWIEGAGDYARVHCGERDYLCNARLRTLAATLDERFVRVHRSAIVNVERIRELRHLSHGDYEATLDSGTCVRVSRRRRDELQRRLAARSVRQEADPR